MDPIYQLIVFMQNKRVIAHKELFVLNNENLEDRLMNIWVSEPGFKYFDNFEHGTCY